MPAASSDGLLSPKYELTFAASQLMVLWSDVSLNMNWFLNACQPVILWSAVSKYELTFAAIYSKFISIYLETLDLNLDLQVFVPVKDSSIRLFRYFVH